MAGIYGLLDRKKRAQQVVKELGLEEIVENKAKVLSGGWQRRLSIAMALITEPEVLFLDEPTIGLDAVSKLAVRDFIRQLNQEQNTTVILTTHDMQDIEALTNRIILIGKGKILLDGSMDDIRQDYDSTEEALAAFYCSHGI